MVVITAGMAVALSKAALLTAAKRSYAAGGRMLPPLLLTNSAAQVTNTSLRGTRTAIVVYSSHCGHCSAFLEAALQVMPEFEHGIHCYFAAVDDEPLPSEKGNVRFYHGGGKLLSAMGIQSVPVLILVDEQGSVVSLHEGEMDAGAQRAYLIRFLSLK